MSESTGGAGLRVVIHPPETQPNTRADGEYTFLSANILASWTNSTRLLSFGKKPFIP